MSARAQAAAVWRVTATRGAAVFRVVEDRVRRHPVLGEVYEFIDGSLGDFARDHGPMYAGALAFYAVLSLVPLIILFASASGFFLAADNTDAALAEVMVQLRKVIPYLEPRFEGDLRAIIMNRKQLGALGVAALLLSASEVFRGLEFALARIFARLDHTGPTDEKAAPRNYFKSKLWFGAFVTSLVLAFVMLRLLVGVFRRLIDVLRLPPALASMLDDSINGSNPVGQLITWALLAVGFVVVVKVFSHADVKARFAAVGGVLFMVLFQAAHKIYDVYLQRITNIGAMYGSLATLVIIILWIYFSSTLLLLCCHVTKVVQRRVLHGPQYPKDLSILGMRKTEIA